MQSKVEPALQSVAESQPPMWGIAIIVAQKFLATLTRSENTALQATSAMLMSFAALVKLEGFLTGVFSFQEAQLQALAEIEKDNADPAEVLSLFKMMIEREHLKVTQMAPDLYKGMYMGLRDQVLLSPPVPGVLDPAAESFTAFNAEALKEFAAEG